MLFPPVTIYYLDEDKYLAALFLLAMYWGGMPMEQTMAGEILFGKYPRLQMEAKLREV